MQKSVVASWILLGPSLRNVLIAIIVVTWPIYARLIHGQVLTRKERAFILAAHAIGVPKWRILLRHILPNALAPLLVQGQLRSRKRHSVCSWTIIHWLWRATASSRMGHYDQRGP